LPLRRLPRITSCLPTRREVIGLVNTSPFISIDPGNFPEADFWPATLKVHPGHNFWIARHSTDSAAHAE